MIIQFTLQSQTDGSFMIGQASNTTVYISKDGGAFAATTNAVAEIGRGLYKVELTAAETAFTTLILNPVCAGAQNNLYSVDAPTDISGLATSSALADVATTANGIKAKTDNLPTVPAAKSDIPSVQTIQSGLATSSALSAVASNVSAVKAKTDNLPAEPASVGNVTTAQEAIIAAMPDISGLSTFNAETDAVNVSSSSANAIRAGLSTFDPTQSYVIINPSQAATMTTATGFATASDIPSASDNASAVWNSNSRTLTESALTAQNVWEYANRTLTTEQAITSDDISNIASGVWSANARTLTESIPTEDSITAKVWTYPNRTLTEDLSGLYCTRQDVEQRWGKLNVAVMADAENDGDEFTISTHIKAAIIKATNRINSELASSIYSLPFMPVPDIVKQHAAALAGVELYRVRSVAVTNDAALFTAAETEFSNWVIAVYNGLQIPGARELPE